MLENETKKRFKTELDGKWNKKAFDRQILMENETEKLFKVDFDGKYNRKAFLDRF